MALLPSFKSELFCLESMVTKNIDGGSIEKEG